MRPARTAADGRPLRCGAVRDGSACGRPASLPFFIDVSYTVFTMA